MISFANTKGLFLPYARILWYTPIQILEALEAGARAILLIVRALNDEELKMLRGYADAAGMDCLYEVHELHELEKALRHEPKILGVNNRDLTRFVTDLGTTEQLFPQIPDGIIKVSESGITQPEDAWACQRCRGPMRFYVAKH